MKPSLNRTFLTLRCKLLAFIILYLKFCCSSFICAHQTDPLAPDNLHVKIINEFDHPQNNFTQGLIYVFPDKLWESSGLYGKSKLIFYNFKTGQILQSNELPSRYFGEGIAMVDNKIIQLTWKEEVAFQFDSLRRKIFNFYRGEGWGLCADDNFFWMTNGSEFIYKRSLSTFDIIDVIQVNLGGEAIKYLNDLVAVGDFLYINVFMKDYILKVEKMSGKITAIINAKNLISIKLRQQLSSNAVLNGITYKSDTDTFLITGKLWPKIFEVKFE